MNTRKRETLRKIRRQRRRDERRERGPSHGVEVPARPREEERPTRPRAPTVPVDADVTSPGERSWLPWIDGFLATRSLANPEEAAYVMRRVLSEVRSWASFVSGEFLALAPTYVGHRTSYRAGRTYQLFERFVRWMHTQREVTDWQRDVLLREIERQRYCEGLRTELPPALELTLSDYDIPRFARELAPTFEDPVLADEGLVASALRCLQSHLKLQLGESRHPPVGSLDPHQLVRDVSEGVEDASDHEHNQALFTMLSVFYEWAGKSGRLERGRAAALASTLASAAMPVVAVQGMAS
ncbi:MAG: hypothetical protein H6721_00665 [Sandaracinus sp.]|nr:hypothetical protein [Sandaracinus sp.]MCB9625607.1 hypothetical protein [Sandaracinus sp.]MCB9630656.1 hypothetical protein [Sandaracinus sp.]